MTNGITCTLFRSGPIATIESSKILRYNDENIFSILNKEGGYIIAMTGVMGGLYRLSEWIMRFSVINLLWLLGNLPIVFLLLSLLLAEDLSQLLTLLISIGVLMPFLFFPATTAMFGVVRKWVMGEYEVPLLRSFWTYYRENYVRSMVGGFIFVLIWTVWIVDFYYFSQVNQLIGYAFIFGFILLYVITIYFIANTVHVDLKLVPALKNSLLLAIGNPLYTLFLVISNVGIIYISFYVFTFLIPFFMGVASSFLSFTCYYKSIVRIESLKEKKQ